MIHIACYDCGKIVPRTGTARRLCAECAKKRATDRSREYRRQKSAELKKAAEEAERQQRLAEKGIDATKITPAWKINEEARNHGMTYGQYMVYLREKGEL